MYPAPMVDIKDQILYSILAIAGACFLFLLLFIAMKLIFPQL